MKAICLFILIISLVRGVYAQTEAPSHFTPAQIQSINASVERKAAAIKKKLEANSFESPGSQEFHLDTFKAEESARLKMDIAESSSAMNEVTNELSAAYDKILNKYYNRLLKLLTPEDQKILIQAQRSWLTFQTAERNLLNTLMDPAYSGGGSIQSNIHTAMVAELLIKRSQEIGAYYQMVSDTKENGE